MHVQDFVLYCTGVVAGHCPAPLASIVLLLPCLRAQGWRTEDGIGDEPCIGSRFEQQQQQPSVVFVACVHGHVVAPHILQCFLSFPFLD